MTALFLFSINPLGLSLIFCSYYKTVDAFFKMLMFHLYKLICSHYSTKQCLLLSFTDMSTLRCGKHLLKFEFSIALINHSIFFIVLCPENAVLCHDDCKEMLILAVCSCLKVLPKLFSN